MPRTSFAVALLVALSSAVACSDQQRTEPTSQSRSPIQGGTDDASHPFAVGLCLQAGSSADCTNQNPDGSYPVGICSGALIAPNLVVTARHCVQNTCASPPCSGQIDCPTSVFGPQLGGNMFVTTDSDFATATHWHSVSAIDVPTPTAVCGNDIALVTLSDVVAASEAVPIIPVVQYPMSDHSRYSLVETAIGFGATGAATGSAPGAGQRRILSNIAIECDANDPATAVGCQGAFDASPSIATPNEFFTGNGTCEGDSGSSAFDQRSFNNGQYYSFGVLSRGGQDGTTCVGGVYTRLDAWRDLIVQTVTTAAAAGGYPVPSWTEPAPVVVPDAGPPPSPTGQLGDSCNGNGDCASNICESSTCTQACDDNNTCPSDYACNGGFCMASSPNNGTTSTTTSSCGCKLAGGPSNPVPWRALGVVAFGAIMLRRRRRSRTPH